MWGLYKRESSQLPEGCPINGFYPKLREGYAIDVFIPMNGEGCMYGIAAWIGRIELRASELVHGTSWEDTEIICSLWLRTVQLIVLVLRPTGSTPPPGGVFPDPLKAGLMWAWFCQGGVPCGIRSQPLQDLYQVVRIEHRRRSLCCPVRVWSVHVFQNRLSGVWASGNSEPLLYARCAGKQHKWNIKYQKGK